ncbi:hypothetical protein AZE42_05475 [Rhizopogon vesiculosus]|uniref:Uncharacterized protein n=1 Tax=Rhizopogon vesiculosus TaxID=180088 RepID=A0A1J8PV65_9AGAM|nr:hypothetical protein AZE42_05475 [Rhizopogon vesiculosus]
MPLQLLSRPTDTARANSPSLLATPAPKHSIPTIRLVAATPSEANNSVAPWSEQQPPTPLAPKASSSDAAPRKRLVPKKSKLGILPSRERDLSDVVRRVGAGSSNRNGSAGIEIYVDPIHDPEIAEIVVVKKKKSRVALDGMRWGPALGEVTNIPHVKEKEKKERKKDKENTLKVNVDEKGGWWSIGRGRKDSKEKEKENSKAPESVCSAKGADSRTRFGSLDSGILLNSPIFPEHPKSPVESQHLRVPTPPSATLASNAMLAPPAPAQLGSGKDSVALRAMRSVRSLARIGSWAQLKNMPAPDDAPAPPAPTISEPKKKKKKKDKDQHKEKEKEKEKHKAATMRYSGSSFEAGALTASPAKDANSRTLLSKKKSILGLGLPSTIRLPSRRNGSTASSIVAAQMQTSNSSRPSVDSATLLGCGILSRARSGSTNTASSAGSVRPISVSSGGSSAGCSVRWDEAGLQTVKEVRKKERALKEKDSIKKGKKSKETRKSSDSRKRTPLAAVFPGGMSEPQDDDDVAAPLIVTIEEATVDGHGQSDLETPIKRARPRPMSEMLLGRSRPKAMYEDENENAMISLLDAATNDLAQLINRLDLEATPDMTPMSGRSFLPSEVGSPTRHRMTLESPIKALRASAASVSSLRPYAKTVFTAPARSIGQHIAPWATLNAGISPAKPSPPPTDATKEPAPAFRLTHKRTLSPAPAEEPQLVFQALRPAKSRVPVSERTVLPSSMGARLPLMGDVDRSPSSRTFGSAHSASGSRGSLGTSPVFKKASGHQRKPSSLAHTDYAELHDVAANERHSLSLPIAPDARRNLGLAGTLGESVGAQELELDASDPDSDIPDELQVILSSSDHEIDDTLSFNPNPLRAHPPLPSPGLPPEMPLPSPKGSIAKAPVFRANVIDEDEQLADIEEAGMSSEDDTKKSFDFTGELQKLNESGGSDRLSFVEQLENAFRTPAKVDLRYDFDLQFGAPPPVPKIPSLQAELERAGDTTFNLPVDYISQEFLPQGFPMDVDTEPSLLPGTDSFATTNNGEDEDFLCAERPRVLRTAASIHSRPSDGQLNRDFKFGGKPSTIFAEKKEQEPLTLSDIIPPSAIAKSLSATSLAGDETAVLNSIFAKAVEIPSPPSRVRLNSDSSSKLFTRTTARASNVPGHYRHSSELSFAGFDSFTEVRRGFEFRDNRPNFYPPPGATSRAQHNKRESMFSIASVSSYGQVINNGSMDPFDYGVAPLPSLRERPSSDEFSFSVSSIDDTFSFIHRQPRRRRVDSDASSFYFRTSVHSQIHPYNRVASHRRHSSSASVASLGPPISLYNRSCVRHRRNDSNTSMSSVAQPYAHGGRAAWARHRPELSADSVLSDFSGIHLGRPGLGDKMLDSALDRGMPLAAISASPPESPAGSEQFRINQYANRTSYDSIMGSDPEPQRVSNMEDSIFEKTGHRTSVSSSDSAEFFGVDSSHAPPQFRPLSSYSIASVHSPQKEDDTMISMLGGGHVRRRSVGSMIEASPCRQVEKRKHVTVEVPQPSFCLRDKLQDDYESPKSRVIETKPSIASTANSIKFGDERMIRAKHGLLERQSLENTALIADGEEDLSTSFRIPVFTRPSRANRSRSSTCTSMSSGAETPPLSISDGYSSFSEGSQSSIDLSHVNYMLSNVTHPLSNATLDRVRPRAHGHGHRRRISQARASRTSIYETIEEELTTSFSPTSSPQSLPGSATKAIQLPDSVTKTIGRAPVYIVDPETASMDSVSMWDDEKGIMALRKYYALRDEAQDTVTESKQVWLDTPFSIFAVQSFDPPHHPSGMKALLEHSMQSYGPLPSELRPRRMRSRVNSRPSPYPRTIKTSFTSAPATEQMRAAIVAAVAETVPNAPMRTQGQPKALQLISVNPNIMSPAIENNKAAGGVHGTMMSPGKPERVFGLPPRPRVGSTARRAALGWAKRSSGRNGLENKENASIGSISLAVAANISQGLVMTPSETLRLNRPRPRGRPTPASIKPIRV